MVALEQALSETDSASEGGSFPGQRRRRSTNIGHRFGASRGPLVLKASLGQGDVNTRVGLARMATRQQCGSSAHVHVCAAPCAGDALDRRLGRGASAHITPLTVAVAVAVAPEPRLSRSSSPSPSLSPSPSPSPSSDCRRARASPSPSCTASRSPAARARVHTPRAASVTATVVGRCGVALLLALVFLACSHPCFWHAPILGTHSRLLLASDGLWDLLTPAHACRLVRGASTAQSAADLLLAVAERLSNQRRGPQGQKMKLSGRGGQYNIPPLIMAAPHPCPSAVQMAAHLAAALRHMLACARLCSPVCMRLGAAG